MLPLEDGHVTAVAAAPGADLDVLDHVGLVVTIARKHERSGRRVGLDVEDLAGEGLLAVLKGAEKYDPSRGAESTFVLRLATWAMWRKLEQAKPLRSLPADEEGEALEPAAPEEPDHVEIGEAAAELLRVLPARWLAVVELRFGLDGNPPMTLAAIGKRLGVSTARASQRLAKALAKMRVAADRLGMS